MKKIILFIVSIFIINHTNAQEQKEFVEYYNLVSAKGSIKTSGQIDEDGFATGEWKHYLENGVLEYKINHSTNISKKYYATGELKEKGSFNPDTGAHIGEWIIYHKNGNIKTKGINDENGEKNGEFKTYFENGTLKSCEVFIEGMKQL